MIFNFEQFEKIIAILYFSFRSYLPPCDSPNVPDRTRSGRDSPDSQASSDLEIGTILGNKHKVCFIINGSDFFSLRRTVMDQTTDLVFGGFVQGWNTT